MKLSDLSVRRPVFATVLSLLIVAFGIISYFRLPVREFPNIDVPIVSVDTRYRGAAAAVVESRITQIIEDRLSGIEGLKAITSTNRDGRSSIDIEFQINRDIDDAANDVRDRVSGVINNLPPEADPPQISKVDADAQPIMFVGLFSDKMSRLELTEYAERFVSDRLSAVNGVARVQIFGGARPSMRIWLDRNRLAAFGMTTTDVENALRRQNIELPAGRVESSKMNLTVRVERYYETPQQFSELIVQRGANGYLVRLGDVARVELGPENPYARFRGDGKDAAGIGIVRQSNANTLEVAQGVRKVVEEIDKTLPKGVKLSINFDSSVFIAEAIKKVWKTIFEAALLVIAVIFIFLGSVRATLIPAVAVPVSLLGAFILLSALGYSLNLLTLLALVLAIGLVVDDAIVVLENIYHRTELGESPLVAAYKGASEVGFAVVASTVVVIAVFVPIVFLSGTVGKLFTELAAAMVGAVAVSLLVSLTLTPAMCAAFLKANRRPGKLNIWIDTRFRALSDAYIKLLSRFSASIIPSIVAIVAVAGLIFFGGKSLKSELAPEEDTGIFFISGQLAEGAGFDYALSAASKMEAKLLEFREKNPAIFRIIVRAPGGGGGGNADEFNSVASTIILKDWSERTQNTKDVVQDVQKLLSQLPEIRANANQRGSLSGSRGGSPVQFVIAGSSYPELARARDKIFDAAKSNPGFQNLDADYKETKPQLILSIDRNRAADLGISVEAIGNTLETMMGSKRVTTFLRAGEEYDVILQADRMDRMEMSDLANTYVRSSTTNELVPLSNVLTMKEKADAGTLGRYNKLRAITLQGRLAPGYTLGEALTFLEDTARPMPEIAAIGYKGESRDFKETGQSIYFVLLLTIVVIYLVLAAQFESFIHPFTIILTVPLAVSGAVLGLWLLGGTLNIYSQVGIIMLVGLATKNGILIVEFANQLRDRGLSISEAVFEASTRRLRPVIMTSIATVAGAVPLMLASGAGAASRTAIGIVIVFGVTMATLLTLFIIPSVYLRLARFTQSPDAVSRDLDSQLAQGQTQPAE
jgi:multidrug efflux pump